MKCVAHRLGFDWECRTPEECNENRSPDPNASGMDRGDSIGSLGVGDSDPDDSDGDDQFSDHQTYKDDSALRDQQSTGRKRAARWFPLDETKLCEWAMKTNCGGGKFPIVGCLSNLQQARHHGPDKNTLNNEKGNVHRICHSCHNRWHTLNDEGYVWGDVHDLHNPNQAEVADIIKNEEFWSDRKVVKAKD